MVKDTTLALNICLFFFIIFGFSDFAKALLVSDVDLNYGQSALRIQTRTQNISFTSTSTLEFNYNLLMPSWNTAFCMSFFETYLSNQGSMAFTRWAIGNKFYFFGVIRDRLIIDTNVEATILKPKPFIGAFLGISNLSTKDFNASSFDSNVKLGVEVPMSTLVTFVAILNLHSSIAGSAPIEKSYSYNGYSYLLGMKINDF